MSLRDGRGRREFLRGVGRYALALLLGGGVGAMVARDGRGCANPGICRDCAALEGCRLPQALQFRQAPRGEPG